MSCSLACEEQRRAVQVYVTEFSQCCKAEEEKLKDGTFNRTMSNGKTGYIKPMYFIAAGPAGTR